MAAYSPTTVVFEMKNGILYRDGKMFDSERVESVSQRNEKEFLKRVSFKSLDKRS